MHKISVQVPCTQKKTLRLAWHLMLQEKSALLAHQRWSPSSVTKNAPWFLFGSSSRGALLLVDEVRDPLCDPSLVSVLGQKSERCLSDWCSGIAGVASDTAFIIIFPKNRNRSRSTRSLPRLRFSTHGGCVRWCNCESMVPGSFVCFRLPVFLRGWGETCVAEVTGAAGPGRQAPWD